MGQSRLPGVKKRNDSLLYAARPNQVGVILMNLQR